MDRVEKICKDYGINVKLVATNTYQNIDYDTPVNIDRLKRTIDNCYLLVSDDVDEVKVDGCYWESIAKVYYIITDLSDRKGLQIYYNMAEKEHGEVIMSAYKSDTTELESMSTLYTAEENGVG